MTHYALLVLAAGLLAAADAPREDASKQDLQELQGTWTLASGEDDGKPLPEALLKDSHLTFDRDQHTAKVGDKTYRGTHKLDASTKPKAIDITDTEGPFKDKTVRGIYELEGDEFRICYAVDGKDRPKQLLGKAGTGQRYHVWKRVKK